MKKKSKCDTIPPGIGRDRSPVFPCLRFLFFLLAVFLAGTHGAHAQRPVTLARENAEAETVIKEIERQSGYTIVYNNAHLAGLPRISVRVTNADALTALNTALRGTGLQARMVEDYLVVSRDAAGPQGQARTMIVTGRVFVKNSQPLPGATVRLKGTNVATSTDSGGAFTLTVPSGEATLVVSFVGMTAREVTATANQPVVVTLEEDATSIDEVVVRTGIFDKPRESYTGAVTTISRVELDNAGNHDLFTQIRNLDPSFNIMPSNYYGSDPNRLPDIQMRGSTSLSHRDLQGINQNNANLPLFIVDGFPSNLTSVMDMDSYLIESVTLLKDAAATAMYGAQGANGIVVITTRKPAAGKARITYRGNLNVEAPDFSSYNLLNAREKLEYEVLSGWYAQADRYPNAQIDYLNIYNQRRQQVERGVDTYWLKYPVRTGIGHRHSLKIEGGDRTFIYSANVSYNYVAGVMKKSSRETVSGDMTLRYNKGNFNLTNTLTVTFNTADNSPYGTFSTYTLLNPYLTPYDDDGNLQYIMETIQRTGRNAEYTYNPLYNAILPYKNQSKYDYIRDNFSLEWTIAPGLVARGRLALTKRTGRTDRYVSAKHSSEVNSKYSDYERRGSYTYTTNYEFRYEADFTLNYSKTFAEKHLFYAGLNYNFSDNSSESHTIEAEGYAAENMFLLGTANGYKQNGVPHSTDAITRRLGGVLNINYTFDRKYFADFSGKMDASSQFGAKKRTAPFWSAGIGWNMHHENFMRDQGLINSLRLRLSYGTTGSQNFSPYQAMMVYRFYSQARYRMWSGSYLASLGNDDLEWQTTNQYNAGLEGVFFDERVRLNVDVYRKVTDNLLADVDIPTAGGFYNYKSNIGKVRNTGFEVTANIFIIKDNERDIRWSVGGSMYHNKNKILKISETLKKLNEQTNQSDGGNPSFLLEEGRSINTIYAVRSLGIDPANGQEIFLKADGKTRTYAWSSNDKVPCGVAEPKVNGVFNTSLHVKGLSLNMIFGFSTGGDMYNQTLINKVENVGAMSNVDRRAFEERWKKVGDDVRYKAITHVSLQTKATSRFIMRENTVECRSISVGYEFPRELCKKIGADYLSLQAYTEDVFRISTIKQERGTAYPYARKFSLSLTARF